MQKIPSAYQVGYERARLLNPSLAGKYIEHTLLNDPVADAVIEALAEFEQGQVHRFIKAGMEQNAQLLAKAPRLLRDFFEEIETPPAWFDRDAVFPGRQAFHEYSDLFIPAFFVATLQNASTLISKAFYTTGRVLSGFGARRIRQNTRHFIEIMLPGSLERQSDGWKQSVRIRLVHAQVRRLIRSSGNWNESVYGAPLSVAHLALASANFSATILKHVQTLGAQIDDAARNGFMQIWRYASTLIGTPEALLFDGDEAKTKALSQLAHLCEPPPGDESVAIANALVKALPDIARKTDPDDRHSMVAHTYRVSRTLLGDELADQLSFPRQSTAGLLTWMRLQRRAHRISHRMAPGVAQKWRGKNFVFLLEASMLDDLSYRIPDHLKADKATPW